MMKNASLKKITLSLVLLVGLTRPASPLSETAANVFAVGGGAITGGLAGLGVYSLMDGCSTNERALAAVIVGLGVGGISWYFLNDWLFQLTPRGKYLAASKIVSWVSNDSFVVRDFSTPDELLGFVNIRFATSWPLVLAREHGTHMVEGLNNAREILASASLELQEGSDFYGLIVKIKELETHVLTLLKVLESRVMLIIKQDDYLHQVKLFEKHQEAERQRAHEEKLQSNALWHDSLEKSEDRWHDRSERNKDRQTKRQALAAAAAAGNPVMVGV